MIQRQMPLDQALVKSAWPSCLKEQQYCGFLYTKPFTQQKEHCDWLILGHVSLIKFKLYPDRDTITQLSPVRQIKQHMFCHMIVYTLNVWFRGKQLVLFSLESWCLARLRLEGVATCSFLSKKKYLTCKK